MARPHRDRREAGRGQDDFLSDDDALVLDASEAARRLGTDARLGLGEEEASRRLERYGPNEAAPRRKRSAAGTFLSKFKDPLVIILLLAGTVTLFTGQPLSAAVIYTIVLISTGLTFFQEHRSERASEELSKKVRTMATVVRGGAKREVPLSELVPGDVVHLSTGDIVPAECRVLSSRDLFVNESALTGESMAVGKSAAPPARGKPADRSDYLFMGTSVVNGSAVAAVVRTGRSTRYAEVAEKLVQRRPPTEFEKGSRRFGYLIMRVTFALVVVVFIINAANQRGIVDSLLFSVALAVGLTPELLPLILTINLTEGAMDMSRKGVIVKRLEAIQNYGSMDILCTDKTGTLTQNKVVLVQYVGVRGEQRSEPVLRLSYINSYFETGQRSPLDGAIVEHGGVDVSGYQLIEEVPFDFERKRVSVVVRGGGKAVMMTKGAPESMFGVSSYYDRNGSAMRMDPETLGRLREMYRRMSADGLRVLGVAYKDVEDRQGYGRADERDLVFAGFVAFLDPPKESTREALRMLRDSNVAMKVITGDSELVTRKVCSELGFEITGVVLGSELDKMNDPQLKEAVERANVFARTDPVQKARIITALKANGHVVGYLGDGVNDAPSVRAADVGISVDNAVDVAKEAADIILLKNDLRVLNQGVLDGRRTFGNTMKYIQMGVSSNFGNMFSAAGASLFLPFLPMLPLQILLNNLLYDLSETAIPTDNVDREYISRPRKLDVRYVRDFMVFFGPISSAFDFLTFFVLLYLFHAGDGLFQTAWFIESVVTQTLVIFAIRTRATPFFLSRPSLPVVLSSLAVAGFAVLMPFTPLAGPFQMVPPPPEFYAFLAVVTASYLIVVDLVKSRFYRRRSLGTER